MSKLSKNLGLLLGGGMGVATSWMLSAPKSPVKQKLPEAGIKSIEILPNVRIKRHNKTYHIHHWMFFSVFYASLMLIRKPVAGRRFINGFVLGLIFQGLSYKDRLHVKNPSALIPHDNNYFLAGD